MAHVRVKICGITSLDDAVAAERLGADALGFNFYHESPRYVAPEAAKPILRDLSPFVEPVAVFVNEPKEKVAEVLGKIDNQRQSINCVQFHGEESGDYCRSWKITVIKAFRVKEKKSLEKMKNFPADFYLLDSWSPGFGGSGDRFPWEWLENVDAAKLILSGGLHAGNVVEAIRRIRPYAVDVCSGVEAHPGIKDHEKLKEFILAAKNA